MDRQKFTKTFELDKIKIKDEFWNSKTELVKSTVLPYQFAALNDEIDGVEKSYCIENFKKAVKFKNQINNRFPTDKWHYDEENSDKDAFHGWVFQDSDAYKWLEAVGYSLIVMYDIDLWDKASKLIDLICSAQLDDGYLDTLYIINNIDNRFENLKDFHELYCFGHLVYAAVSIFKFNGDKRLLNCAYRFADLISDTFNENGKKGYPGHEIAESALIELYNISGKKKYLDTAEFFILQRGTKPYYFDIEKGKNTDGRDYVYNQAHKPVTEQTEAVGHAVRAVYLYRGMAELSKETDNENLLSACNRIWRNIIDKKMYITGGIGATADGEAFSFDYDLPNGLAYSETCAAIGLVMFANEMSKIESKAEFDSVIERALYNNILASCGEDGKSFFYANPLEMIPEASRKDTRYRHAKAVRQGWFNCACCPPNYARLMLSLQKYIASENENSVIIRQYIGSKIESDKALVRLYSAYLRNGHVRIEVKHQKDFTLKLRIPDWCKKFDISAPYKINDGFAEIKVSKDTEIDINFNIEPRFVMCSSRVRQNVGKLAVMRGPMVYCAEEIDNGKDLHRLKFDTELPLSYCVGEITAKGVKEADSGEIYSDFKQLGYESIDIKLIPYYKWGNRGENEMRIYFRYF